MPERGFFFDLADQMENSPILHQALIDRIEQDTGHNLICYYAPFTPVSTIQDQDPDLLENILRSVDLEKYERKLDLMINSPGGSPYAAAKMVRVCRVFSSEFRTIVIGRAMSAATLLCLGAHELLMGVTASLGPIDPGVFKMS